MNSHNKSIEESFDKFTISSDLKEILSAFNQLCDLVDLNPSENSSSFYKTLQYKLKDYWKAQTLFSKLDKKVSQKEYRNQNACHNIKALIIGSGPCGLRCAIELALLGARVVVIDKRDSFSRNNVLHLWPFVINDLKALGAKIFFGMFCAGSIDHISIRRLQCILFKVALLFGVQFFVGVAFHSLIPPSKTDNTKVSGKGDIEHICCDSGDEHLGWQAKVSPDYHIVSNYKFNTIIGADGKTNVLGFPRKELRCRLAIAITGNFINRNTSEEAQVEEISGVAFIFNQQYFKDIYKKTGIDLENIVYYKNETHYFVMTAKKHSLLSKGVIKQDFDDPAILLNPNNINYEALQNYAKEAANVATDYRIPNLEFSKNHRGEPDVAMFDFTHMFAAENASKVIENNGCLLLQMLVGDSLLEPFWPTGSGCALGFLSSLDAAWLVRRLGMINNALELNKISHYQQKMLILEAIGERESVYQRLSQTTSSNMPQNFSKYTLNPRTRYSQCKMNVIEISQILHLYEMDDKSKKIVANKSEFLNLAKTEVSNKPNNPLASVSSPKLMGINLSFNNSFRDSSITKNYVSNSSMKGEYMLRWFQIRLDRYFSFKSFRVDDLSTSWYSGVAFLCLIHLYRPDSIDLSSINHDNKLKNLETAFALMEKEFHVSNTFRTTANSIENLDPIGIFLYLEKIYETLRVLNPNRSSEEIYDHHQSMEMRKIKRRCVPLNGTGSIKKLEPLVRQMNSIPKPTATPKRHEDSVPCKDIEKGIIELRKEEILKLYTSNFKEPPLIKKSVKRAGLDTTDGGWINNAVSKQKDFKVKVNEKFPTAKTFEKYKLVVQICHFCKTRIFQGNHDMFENYAFHKSCFRCQYCNTDLNKQQFKLLKSTHESEERFYCLRHFEKLSNISFIREKNVSNTLRDLVMKEDKKYQRLFSKGSLNVSVKRSREKSNKIKKPRYSLKDFGCSVPNNQTSCLPVQQLFDNMFHLSESDIEIYLKKNLLNLKRVNNESDEEYNGSLDESNNRLLSLEVVEPLEENLFRWNMCFNKQDLEYAMKKCQVIRKNRLIYKKYKSKDESTSDESEINMLVHDICKTSDEDVLDEVISPDSVHQADQSESPNELPKDISPSDPQQSTISNLISDNGLIAANQNQEPEKVLTDSTLISDTCLKNVIETETDLVDKVVPEIKKIDNSRSLRQMAKLKFCTEPPKPVSINPKEFISQINHNKMVLVNLPCYLQQAELLPSVNDVFVTVVRHHQTLSAQTQMQEKKCFLSATIVSIDDYGRELQPSPCPAVDLTKVPSDQCSLKSTTNCSPIMSRSFHKSSGKCNNARNIFTEMGDIKDIDSLSVDTEDSSVTHTELLSEKDVNRNILLNPNLKTNQKATLDSELEISLDLSSIGAEKPLNDNRLCSDESLNSIGMSSLDSSSLKSDISASSESDGENYHNRKLSALNDIQLRSRKEEPTVEYFNKSLQRNQSIKLKSNAICTSNNKQHYRPPSSGVGKRASTGDINNRFRDQCADGSSLFCNTVTPPYDVELDDNPVKRLEVNSQFQFVIENPIPLKDLDDKLSTRFNRANRIHRQLENIEDRLNDMNFRENYFRDDPNDTADISDSKIILSSDIFQMCDYADQIDLDELKHNNNNNKYNYNKKINDFVDNNVDQNK